MAAASLVGLIFLGSGSPALGQESREALIASKQAEKAGKLQPYVPKGAERLLTKVEQIFILQPSGFYPYFDSVYSGGGFTLGAGYRQYYGDRTHADLKGLYSISGYKLIEMSTDSWGHADCRLDLHARGYRRIEDDVVRARGQAEEAELAAIVGHYFEPTHLERKLRTRKQLPITDEALFEQPGELAHQRTTGFVHDAPGNHTAGHHGNLDVRPRAVGDCHSRSGRPALSGRSVVRGNPADLGSRQQKPASRQTIELKPSFIVRSRLRAPAPVSCVECDHRACYRRRVTHHSAGDYRGSNRPWCRGVARLRAGDTDARKCQEKSADGQNTVWLHRTLATVKGCDLASPLASVTRTAAPLKRFTKSASMSGATSGGTATTR